MIKEKRKHSLLQVCNSWYPIIRDSNSGVVDNRFVIVQRSAFIVNMSQRFWLAVRFTYFYALTRCLARARRMVRTWPA